MRIFDLQTAKMTKSVLLTLKNDIRVLNITSQPITYLIKKIILQKNCNNYPTFSSTY